eukprot:TRINITY_DN7061_c0_g1_i1.p1 TRINITY_DN7061_c0_g1~~TRINITY_DN7061_c0_g1_i1.p1  ORF type:complete len:427 (+),score=67.95 TRINITY_DN7061_c0_g1_i1:189-1469(+)
MADDRGEMTASPVMIERPDLDRDDSYDTDEEVLVEEDDEYEMVENQTLVAALSSVIPDCPVYIEADTVAKIENATSDAPAAIPNEMTAAVLCSHGFNQIQIGRVPVPDVTETQVLIAVQASSVNPLDSKMRNGSMGVGLDLDLPHILGFDCSGIVVKTGANVTKYKIGDEVIARAATPSTFAEFATVEEQFCALKPASLSHTEASCIPSISLASWQALVDRARLRKGERVMITGAATTFGATLVQLARNLGAYVIGCVNDNEHMTYVQKLGAHQVIDMSVLAPVHLPQVAKDVDVLVDTVGGETMNEAFGCLHSRGGARMVSLAAAVPDSATMKSLGQGPVMQILGSIANIPNYFRAGRKNADYMYLQVQANGAELQNIAELYEGSLLCVPPLQVFPLTAAAEALKVCEHDKTMGHVVLQMLKTAQ